MSFMRLNECTEGTAGVVANIGGTCRATARLLEMGLIPGETVRILRGGCPAILQVGETRLCVRANHLSDITVEPFNSAFSHEADFVEFQETPLIATSDA